MTCDRCGSEVPTPTVLCPICGSELDCQIAPGQADKLASIMTEAEEGFARGETDRARKISEILLRFEDKLPYFVRDAARTLRAKCLASKGELERSIEELEKIEPEGGCGNWHASVLFDKHRKLAELYRRLGDEPAFLTHLEAASEATPLLLGDPGLAAFFFERGKAYLKLLQRGPQAEYLERAISSFVTAALGNEADACAQGSIARLRKLADRGHLRAILSHVPPGELDRWAQQFGGTQDEKVEGFLGSCLSFRFDSRLVERLGRWGTSTLWESGRPKVLALPPGARRTRLAALFFLRGDRAFRLEAEASLLLTNPLADHDPKVQSCSSCTGFLSAVAEQLLAQNPSQEDWQYLARAAGEHPSAEVRSDFLRILASSWYRIGIGRDSWKNYLLALSESKNRQLRLEAVKRLHTLHDPDLVPMFRQLLRDSDPELQAEAVRALNNYGDRDSASELMLLLSHPHHECVVEAIWALSGFGAVEALPAILDLTKSRNPDIRSAAIKAVAVLGGKRGGEV